VLDDAAFGGATPTVPSRVSSIRAAIAGQGAKVIVTATRSRKTPDLNDRDTYRFRDLVERAPAQGLPTDRHSIRQARRLPPRPGMPFHGW
jgi:hypothetical protein